MKIGVALSGCDIGGVSAYGLLDKLHSSGLEIAMLSACGTPALTALPYACGYQDCRLLADHFLQRCRREDMDCAIAGLADEMAPGGAPPRMPVAVHAADLLSGKMVAFTNHYRFETDRLCTFPLDNVYDALSASASLSGGLSAYRYQNMRLCDFSIWHGCPVYPLKMTGLRRTVSLAFVPEQPQTLYEALSSRMIEATAHHADIHIRFAFPAGLALEEYADLAAEKLQKCMDAIYWSSLF